MSRLVVLCPVCNTPFYVARRSEPAWITLPLMYCNFCHQHSPITKDLKDHIREFRKNPGGGDRS